MFQKRSKKHYLSTKKVKKTIDKERVNSSNDQQIQT